MISFICTSARTLIKSCNRPSGRHFNFILLRRLQMDNQPRQCQIPRYLGQDEAIRVDQELFHEYKFSLDQLMEMAGLSVAMAIHEVYPQRKEMPVIVICGPGNNGGDGIVAARYLKLFGFSDVTILMMKPPSKVPFTDLTHQASQNEVKVSFDLKEFSGQSFGLVVDALFGFSFKPPVRPEYSALMSFLATGGGTGAPVASVDIPSGWEVERGPSKDMAEYDFMPDLLVSLTAPKKCANYFTGAHHFLGGRFVPDKLAQKYSLNLPEYPGTSLIQRLSK